jgi:hypothetical protein
MPDFYRIMAVWHWWQQKAMPICHHLKLLLGSTSHYQPRKHPRNASQFQDHLAYEHDGDLASYSEMVLNRLSCVGAPLGRDEPRVGCSPDARFSFA